MHSTCQGKINYFSKNNWWKKFTIINTLNNANSFIYMQIIISFDLCAFNLFFYKKDQKSLFSIFFSKPDSVIFFLPKNLSWCKKSKKSNEWILRKIEKMVKNDKKRPINTASDFFWKNGFHHFFSDLKICLGAKNLKI